MTNPTRKLGTTSAKRAFFLTMPKAFVHLFNWQKGDDIEITPDTKKQTLTLRKR
jgi:hypothetical protein